MITKNISLAGDDLVKKLTEVPFSKKDARTGHPTTYADDLKLLHQLQVLHLEMELQSEHLRPDLLTLDKLNRKQNELFEFAPNGYFSLTPHGIIQEVNLTGANMMGIPRVHLINQLFSNFISSEDQEVFRICLYNLLETNDYQVFKVSMKKPDGHRLFVRIALSVTKIKNETYVLLAMTDMTMWKQVEEAQAFLLGCSWSESGQDFFQALAQYLGQSLGMEYVSIDKLLKDRPEAEVVALYTNGPVSADDRYKLSGSVYGRIPENRSFCFPNGVHHLFPDDRILQELKAESCAGVTLWGAEGKPIGLIIVIGRKPLMDPRLTEMVLKQVSIRAAAELEHRQLEEALMESRNELEAQVKERTAELQIINEQLRNEIKIRKQQEQSLILAEEKYRTVADFTYNWETWINPQGEYIYVSPSCKRISGYSVEDFMHNPSLFVQIAHPEDRAMVEDHFVSVLKEEVAVGELEFRIITREGKERWIGHHCQPVYDASGRFMGQRGSTRDITQRKEAERILLDSQKHLRLLSVRMDAITEAERTRIAREIHDELGHLLTALKYDVEGLINQTDLSAETLKSELEVMIDMVDSLIDSVRKIATDLRPGILDHLGLFPAIEWQIKQFRLRTKICCCYTLEEAGMTFDKNETSIIFRIMQEILTNITRHSEAKHVDILLTRRDGHFLMEVTDNGVGFDPGESHRMSSLGLIGMKERALSIGGEIQISSHPGEGTTVRLLLPRN